MLSFTPISNLDYSIDRSGPSPVQNDILFSRTFFPTPFISRYRLNEDDWRFVEFEGTRIWYIRPGLAHAIHEQYLMLHKSLCLAAHGPEPLTISQPFPMTVEPQKYHELGLIAPPFLSPHSIENNPLLIKSWKLLMAWWFEIFIRHIAKLEGYIARAQVRCKQIGSSCSWFWPLPPKTPPPFGFRRDWKIDEQEDPCSWTVEDIWGTKVQNLTTDFGYLDKINKALREVFEFLQSTGNQNYNPETNIIVDPRVSAHNIPFPQGFPASPRSDRIKTPSMSPLFSSQNSPRWETRPDYNITPSTSRADPQNFAPSSETDQLYNEDAIIDWAVESFVRTYTENPKTPSRDSCISTSIENRRDPEVDDHTHKSNLSSPHYHPESAGTFSSPPWSPPRPPDLDEEDDWWMNESVEVQEKRNTNVPMGWDWRKCLGRQKEGIL